MAYLPTLPIIPRRCGLGKQARLPAPPNSPALLANLGWYLLVYGLGTLLTVAVWGAASAVVAAGRLDEGA